MEYMSFRGPNFLMEVPTDWVVSSSPQFQAIFLAPHEHGVRPNLVVSLRPVEPQVTVAATAESARANQERQYPEYEVLEEVDFTESGGSGFLRRYQWFNAANSSAVVQTQALFLHQQILYTLTATRAIDMESPTAEDIDTIFEYMIRSFRVG